MLAFSFVNRKGSVGKTNDRGPRRRRQAPEAPPCTARRRCSSATCDWTVIDGPPHAAALTRAAIAASDLAVFPVQPSPLDVWASEDVLALVADCEVVNPDLSARFVLNRLVPRTTLGREVADALGALPQAAPVCRTVVRGLGRHPRGRPRADSVPALGGYRHHSCADTR